MGINSKRKKKEAFSVQSYDNAHYKATDAYVSIVQRLFDRCTEIIAAASAKVNVDPDKPFSFADYPGVKSVMQKATKQLADNMTATVQSGTRKQWEFANKKCDAFIASIMDTSKLTKRQMEQMSLRSLDGLATFQGRKVQGLDLSQRVWKYVDQYKAQMEHALDVGLGEGRDYRQLARDLKTNLREPDRLFRRVRDKRGVLQLSKNAAAYHPGVGVYRSSVKNAQRLARSEINMAYREADWERWQSLDFVVGFEVVRSNWTDEHGKEYKCKVCERLKGRYPKTFKFTGWHPQCRCHAIPIMADYTSKDASNDRIARMRAALYGTEYKKYVPRETVTDVPDGFKEWVAENEEKSHGWASTPYFIRDNFVDGDISKGLKPADVPTPTPTANVTLSKLPDDQRKEIARRISNLELDDELEDACLDFGLDTAKWWNMARKAFNDPEHEWKLVDQCDAERERLMNECDRLTREQKAEANKQLAELKTIIPELGKWNAKAMELAQNYLDAYNEDFAENSAKRWASYVSIMGGSCGRQIAFVKSSITDAQTAFADIKTEAQNIINTIPDKKATAKLAGLANETPRVGRDAMSIIADIKTELAALRITVGLMTPHPALKTDYPKDADVDATFTTINGEMKKGERWFENGDLRLATETNPRNNGSTMMDGRIWLTPTRLKDVKSALAKIGQGKSGTITEAEADAMATFWHEITHNRNIPGNMYTTDVQTRYMELANEFVARHTLDDFYQYLGCKNPHPSFNTNRASTGYNKMVTNYDYVITRCGLDFDKTLKAVQQHLFTGKYSDQVTGLKTGLSEGGLVYVSGTKKGKAIGAKDLTSLVKLVKDTVDVHRYDYDSGKYVTTTKESIIETWLMEHDLLPKAKN